MKHVNTNSKEVYQIIERELTEKGTSIMAMMIDSLISNSGGADLTPDEYNCVFSNVSDLIQEGI